MANKKRGNLREAEKIVALLNQAYPDLVCAVQENLDWEDFYYIWILSDPGQRPDLKKVLVDARIMGWEVDEWANSDQRAEFCCISPTDIENQDQ